MTSNVTPVMVVGCGYVGERLAREEIRLGSAVRAIVRRQERATSLSQQGFDARSLDFDQASQNTSELLAGATVYYLVPPPRHGQRDPRLRAWLDQIQAHRLPRRVILISTTGVYGDCSGEWVSELRPVNPQAARAQRRVDAESTLATWQQRSGVRCVVLRVPGIYGPDRLPLTRLRSGQPVLAIGEAPWSNRIHVDDLVHACIAAARRTDPHGIYNVSDGNPSTMTEFFFQAADALAMPRPPTISASKASTVMGESMLSYLAESKRIDNSLMRSHLGVEPDFPDLASGLADAVRRSTDTKP